MHVHQPPERLVGRRRPFSPHQVCGRHALLALSPRSQGTEEPREKARGHLGDGAVVVNAALGTLGVLPLQYFDSLATVFKDSFLNGKTELMVLPRV